MAEVLAAYIDETTRLEWKWGQRDCALWVADWVGRVKGCDPGAAFRGKYKSEIGCKRLLSRHGGLIGLFDQVCAAVPLPESTQLERGHIGILMSPVRQRSGAITAEKTSAIYAGQGKWAVYSPHGFMVRPAPYLKAWVV